MKAKLIVGGAVFAAGLVLLSAGAGAAQTVRAGALAISQAWIGATPEAAPTAAAYLTVTNRGALPDRLLGGAAPGVQAVTPHSMSMTGGVMRMREISGGLQIPPRTTVILAPGGDHLMMIGLKRGFRAGERVRVRLRFARAGVVSMTFPVRTSPPAPGAPMTSMKMP